MQRRLPRWLAAVIILAMITAPLGAPAAPVLADVPQADSPPTRDGLKPGPRDLLSDPEPAEAIRVETPMRFGMTAEEIERIYGRMGDRTVTIIVQLNEPEVVRYEGGIAGLAATAAEPGEQFDAKTSASRDYIQYLDARQGSFEAAVAQASPAAERVATFVAAMNGVALRLPASDVIKISQLAGVKAIMQNGIAKLDTDAGPSWIGAPSVWATLGGQEVAGEDVVIGIIDTGIWMPNPSASLPYTTIPESFADDASVPGGAYVMPFTSISGVTYTDTLGVCDPTSPQASDDTLICNNKVIGAYWFNTGGIAFAGEVDSPLDENGHGSHTASTAAGNIISPTLGAGAVFMSGVAPRARIIAYKACWDEDPDDPNDGGCAFVDTTLAVEQAILDGVNVINYSIGGGGSVGGDSTELAFLNARAAGIFVSASAGNSGPTPGTVGHVSPWVNTSAAMLHDRDFRASLLVTSTVYFSQPTNLTGASVTGSYTGEIILAPLQGGADVSEEPSMCNEAYAPGTFSGEIVVCLRGIDPRVEKSANVLAGGAGGFVLVNAANDQGLAHDAHPLPAVHLEKNATAFSDAGDDLIAGLKAAALAAETVTATITGGAAEPRPGDVMAAFSSRGPVNINLIKPDNAAPGVSVLAAVSPMIWDNAFVDGQDFGFYNGTSMSSPHTAGAGALLMALYPTWTPAEIQSALMTGAVEILKEDGVTDATPHDQGSGRLNLDRSKSPGLVFDIPISDYQDVVSNTKLIETLNYASMANIQCFGTCSWERSGRNVSMVSSTYTWTIESLTPGLVVTLDQPSYVVADGDLMTFTVTADVFGLPNDGAYAFARVVLVDSVSGAEVALPVAVIPAFSTVPSSMRFDVRRNAGSVPIDDVVAIEITDLQVRNFGLVEGEVTTEYIIEDPTFGDPYDDPDNGAFWITVTVPAGAKRLVAEITESTSLDIDLFVGIDSNANGPEESEEVASSATAAVLEYVSLEDPAPGDYWVLVQNWFGSALQPDLVRLAVAVVTNDELNMDVVGPSAVAENDPFDLRLFWDTPSMEEGDRWYGVFDLGSSVGNEGNFARTAVDIVRIADDVVKTVSRDAVGVGNELTYTITVNPNVLPEDVTYFITDTIPAGMTYVGGSATNGAVVVGDTLTWSDVLLAPAPPTYVMTTSDTDPVTCEVPFANSGAYTNLAAYGVFPLAGVQGDTVTYSAFTTGAPFNIWGVDHVGLRFTDDGFAFASSTSGTSPWVHQDIPNASDPNYLMAMLWRDMELVYSVGTRGVSLATIGGTGAAGGALIEYDDIQVYQDATRTMDMQVWVWRTPDNTSWPEIIFAYDNISGTWGSDGTVGVENGTGTEGVKFGFDDLDIGTKITNGMAICFDWVAPETEPIEITYRVTVDAATEGQTLTNAADSTVDNPGSDLDTTSQDVYVVTAGVLVTPEDDDQVGIAGATLTYTLQITNTGDYTDTFDVAIGYVGATFPATAPSTVGPLAAGDSTSVDVGVTIPAGTFLGSVSEATVTFTSQSDVGVEDDSVLTTTADFEVGLTVTPEEDEQTARLGQAVTYTLMVTNTGESSDTFTVTVNLTGEPFTTTAPSSVGPLAAGASTSLNVVVNIPANAADDDESEATVTFTSRGDGTTNESSVLTTTAFDPIIGVLVTPATASQSAVPGQTVTYTLRVTNTGEVADTFDITIDVTGTLFATNAPSTVGPLAAGAGTNVSVAVVIPGGAENGASSEATVTFTSQDDGATSDEAVLTTTAEYDVGVTVTPATDSQSAVPGQTVMYTLNVTNTGDVADTFDITINISGTAFTTTAPSTVGPLAAGAGTTIQVGVTIPDGTADEAVSEATVTVTSQDDDTISDSAVLTTISAWLKLFMPFIARN